MLYQGRTQILEPEPGFQGQADQQSTIDLEGFWLLPESPAARSALSLLGPGQRSQTHMHIKVDFLTGRNVESPGRKYLSTMENIGNTALFQTIWAHWRPQSKGRGSDRTHLPTLLHLPDLFVTVSTPILWFHSC